MSDVTASVTGHRPQSLGREWDHNGPISTLVVESFVEAYRDFGVGSVWVGGALGVDTLAAWAAFQIGLPYYVAVPFEGQDARWPSSARARYRDMLWSAAAVVTVSPGGYNARKMQTRNEFMVNSAHFVLAWWDHSNGGTGNCVRYAHRRGVEVINLCPPEFRFGYQLELEGVE